MSSKLKINHRPGSTSAEIFIREANLVGNQYNLGDGGDYGYTLHLAPSEEDLETLLELFNAFAEIHNENHGDIKGGFNPIDKSERTLRISWKGKTKPTYWADPLGWELEKVPALADGGVVSVALETWSSVYEKDGDNRIGISFHPAQIRVHEAGNSTARINNTFDDWFDGDEVSNKEDF